jgi:hypothetical protein
MVPDEADPAAPAQLPHWVHPRRRSDPFGSDILEWPRPASAAEANPFSCAACRARLKEEELEKFFSSSAWISWREASESAKLQQCEPPAEKSPRPEPPEDDAAKATALQVAETAVRVVPALLDLAHLAALAPEGVTMCVGCARHAMQETPAS